MSVWNANLQLIPNAIAHLSGSQGLGFWISGNDLDYNSSYVWQSTGNSFSFTAWKENEPNHAFLNNETEHCVAIVGAVGAWNDCGCSSLLYFICEF